MGDVYRARDTRLERSVALKIVDSARGGTADRVLREARAASALNHPNICTLYEAGEFDGQPYLAMEYIAGQPLSSVIPLQGFDPPAVVRYGLQIADALAHAHEHGVIHRDLKAANVVITPQGRAKILDFGVARRVVPIGSGARPATMTRTGTIAGTLPYMAPELFRDRAADARSDIWALGVLLYELAAGCRPFGGQTSFEVTSAILKDRLPPLPARVPPELSAVIARCLARDPDDRFQRASDVVVALEASNSGGRRVLLSAIPRTRRAVLGFGIAATILAAGFAVSHRGGRTPRPAAVAVLPFQVLSGAQEIGFLGIGVPDTIISRIALVRSVRVRALLAPGKDGEDPLAVGRRHGVDYVLTGTIQQGGTQIRITPQLIRVADGMTFWTNSYTFLSADLLRLQDEIAGGVMEALPVQLTSEDRRRVGRQHTQNAEAYALYVRGRTELVGGNQPASTIAAAESFQSALDRDSQYALAHAGLAMASAKMGHFFANEQDVPTWHKRAHQAAQRALQLGPDLAETHEALAAVYRSTEFDWPRTIEEAGQALTRNPSLDLAHLYRASAFTHLGLLERAGLEAKAAMDINPRNTQEPLRVQGAAAMYGGQYEDAVRLLEQAAARRPAPAEWNLSYAYYNAGRQQDAEAMLRGIRTDSVRSHRRAQATLASFLAHRGETVEATRLIDAVIAGSYMDHHVQYALGAAYAQLGRPREAVKWLSDARASGFPCYPWFERDPLLAPLRNTPAFESFLDELKQSWETNKAQFDAQR
jgi:serine/threonine-protein kinase